MKNSMRGMTLVEVAVANTVLAMLLVATMNFMVDMVDTTSLETQALTLEQDANNVLEEMVCMLRAARIVPRPGESEDLGSPSRLRQAGQISFRVPVDYDDDGDTMSDVGGVYQVDWGQQREDVLPRDYLGGEMVYRFVKSREFNEADRNYDLNGDGDRVDQFDIGRIEVLYTAGGFHVGVPIPANNSVTIRMLSGNSVVRKHDQVVADIDDDGQGLSDPEQYDDPIFALNGSVLTITIFTAKPEEDIPLLIKTQTAIELRNVRQ